MEWIQIHWTAGSLQDARKIARYLVQERLVAVAKVVPWVESIALLNNQLETSQETLVQFTTLRSQFSAVEEIIQRQGKFDIAELVAFELKEVNAEYLRWLEENLRLQVGN
jgi:periplasmic divalent cation tolerance protein